MRGVSQVTGELWAFHDVIGLRIYINSLGGDFETLILIEK